MNFLDDSNHLRTIYPISSGLNDVLHRALTIIPDDACSLSEFRKLIRNLDRFWLTEKEVARSRYLAVKETWRTYKPEQLWDALSEESGDSSDDWASAWGGVFESDTSSESGGSLGDCRRLSGSEDRPRSPPNQASAVLKADAGSPPPQPQPKLRFQPQPALGALDDGSAPQLPAVMQSTSSDEFPIRKPGSTLAAGSGPDSPTSSGSEPDSSGPDTPPTRPHDPPAIVTTQPLSEGVPIQAGDGVEAGKLVFGYARRMSLVFWTLVYGELDL